MAGEVFRERYRQESVIARGGEGEVVRARDLLHDRVVALKIREVTSSADRERFLHEARTLLTIPPHPNLAVAREDFFEADRYVLALDWVDGPALARVIAERERLTLDEALPWLEDIAAALDHLHAQDPPVAHGDVNPSNAVIGPDGRAVLVDLGIAGHRARLGTRGFIAPEVAAGDGASPAADVYGLAATIHVALTGRPPEAGTEPPLGHLGAEQARRALLAIQGGLAFDPAARPSAGSLVAALHGSVRTATNLPEPVSSFVGREREMAVLADALGASRLVTLTGPGGIGKTRLAIETTSSMLERMPDGAFIVELHGVRDDALVPQQVARSLAIDAPGDPTEAICRHLAARRPLLIFDNCEQIIEACAELAGRVLRSCRGVRILATSREPLHGEGEIVVPVGPLSVLMTDGELAPAVRLFADRARAVSGAFTLDDAHVAEVRALCESLDGMPLAIELAAALSGAFTPTEIRGRLDEHLPSPLGRGLPDRHRTIDSTVAWSLELLDEQERALFTSLGVFVGGFDLAAATAVFASTDHLARALVTLVDRSLVVATHGEHGTRYRLLEPIRRAAVRRLQRSDVEPEVRRAHLRWIATLTEEASNGLSGPDQTRWLARLDEESGNIPAALTTAIEQDVETGATIATNLMLFWRVRGLLDESERWTKAMLEGLGKARSGARARLLHHWCSLVQQRGGDVDEAEAAIRECLDIQRELGDTAGEREALNTLGSLSGHRADYTAARDAFERALALTESLGEEPLLELNNLGMVAGFQGEHDVARTYFDSALKIARTRNDPYLIASLMGNRGLTEVRAGDIPAARPLLLESLAGHRSLGNREGVARTLLILSRCAQVESAMEEGETYAAEALEIARALGDRRQLTDATMTLGAIARAGGDIEGAHRRMRDALAYAARADSGRQIVGCLSELAKLAAAAGQPQRAGVLFGAVDALTEDAPGTFDPTELEEAEQFRNAARERDLQGFADAEGRGRALPRDQVIAEALAPLS